MSVNFDFKSVRAEALASPVRLYGNAKINVYPTGFISGTISYEDVFRDKRFTDPSILPKPRVAEEKPNFVQLTMLIIPYSF